MGLRLSLFMRLRHYPFFFKMVQRMFDHFPMVLSVSMHLLAIIVLTCDFSMYKEKDNVVSVPVFIVDLDNVKIGEKTNLPPKLLENQKKTPKGNAKSVKTSAFSAAAGGKTTASGGNARGGKDVAAKKTSSGASLESELNKMLDTVGSKEKTSPKKETAANTMKAAGGGKDDGDPFKTLLASVDGIRGGLGHTTERPDVDPADIVTEGVEGGSGGSYTQELSVSERDLLGLKLRQCWNLDPGVRGAQNMKIEIRAFLKQDGTVKDVKILNTGRYGKDPAFRSVAESARRAVYICDKKGDESPFKIFPKYYGQTYDTWKTLLLRFNPFDGGVS